MPVLSGSHVFEVVTVVNYVNEILKLQKETSIFPAKTGGAKQMCLDMDIPFLGRLPLDQKLTRYCDEGKDFISEFADSTTVKELNTIIDGNILVIFEIAY